MSTTSNAAHTPGRLVVVAGTGTEVGKTWVAAGLASHLRAGGATVVARKPAQSFESADVAAACTDADLLAAATGDAAVQVCPEHRWYEVPMAPPMAASALGRDPVLVADLVAETTEWWSTRSDSSALGLVELAGGPWSPAASDGDGIDLTRALAPAAVVLVAHAGLGTLNAVRPALGALSPIAPVHVLLNRFDEGIDLHRRNLDWLREHERIRPACSMAELAEQLTAP